MSTRRVILLVLAWVLLGCGGLLTRLETKPAPTLIGVSVDCPGADVEEVEDTVVRSIEASLAAVPGVNWIEGVSEASRGQLTVVLRPGTEPEAARAAVGEALQDMPPLPDRADAPVVSVLPPWPEDVVRVQLTYPDIAVLEDLTDQLAERAKHWPDVTATETSLRMVSSVALELDPAQLDALGVSAAEVHAQVQAAAPADDPEALSAVRIVLPGGQTVSLSALAAARLTQKPERLERVDGERSAWVTIHASSPEVVRQQVMAQPELVLPEGAVLLLR